MSEMNDVLQVTGLTPESAPDEAPAAPSEAVEAKEEAQPVEQPAATEEVEQDATPLTADAPSETATEEPEPIPEPKKPARGVQKALDRLTAEREEWKQKANQTQDALQALVTRLMQQQTVAAPQTAQQPSGVPKRADYADWEQYNAAVARHEAIQAVRGELQQLGRVAQQQTEQQNVQRQMDELDTKLNQAAAKGRERFKDWDDVVTASDAPIPPTLELAIKVSDDPAYVMHYLGTHPEVHARLADPRMPPARQFMEIGQILASNSAPKAVVSKAPAPAKPIGGARAGVGSLEYNDNFTPAQHKAWLARQSRS